MRDLQWIMERLPELLAEGKPIRLQWGNGSRLRLDRELPFLCVHRCPTSTETGTARLLSNNASSLILAPEDNGRPVIEEIIRTFQPHFGAFFILEVWSKEAEGEHPAAEFHIHPGRDSSSMLLAEHLAQELRRINLFEEAVVQVSSLRPRPEQLGPLLPKAFRQEHNVVLLGLEVAAIYQDFDGNPYPELLRTFRRAFDIRVRQVSFEFIQHFTTFHPPNFQTLGPRATVKLVWQVDKELEEISNSFSFLLQVTPINLHQAWLSFKRSNYEEDPRFVYRPFSLDPTELKRRLFAIPIEKVEEPTFYKIFLEKQHQIDTKISMIARRRTRHFLYGSLSLYGDVSPDLVEQAHLMLQIVPARTRDANPRLIDAQEFAREARREINHYKKQWSEFTPQVMVRDDLETGLLCDGGNLLIGSRVQVPASRVEPLLHHEVGTHLVTYYNGRAQPLNQLALGLADYIEFQEGIAVLSEFLSGHLSKPRLRYLALRVLAVDNMIKGAAFPESFRKLREAYEVPAKRLFDILSRVYRGGGLTKDAVYLRGLLSLLDYLREGGDLAPLFVGKIARHHIPVIQELQWRGVLREAPLQPRILTKREARKRLKWLKEGTGLLPLLDDFAEQGES
ncbi:MAG: tyrosine/phenylalanine carboxypeptidase domain-containing protein [Vulcanimicrobiota bacterium]